MAVNRSESSESGAIGEGVKESVGKWPIKCVGVGAKVGEEAIVIEGLSVATESEGEDELTGETPVVFKGVINPELHATSNAIKAKVKQKKKEIRIFFIFIRPSNKTTITG